MKFSQLIEIFSFKNHAENEAERIVPDFFLFSKTLYEVKASGLQQYSFNILR